MAQLRAQCNQSEVQLVLVVLKLAADDIIHSVPSVFWFNTFCYFPLFFLKSHFNSNNFIKLHLSFTLRHTNHFFILFMSQTNYKRPIFLIPSSIAPKGQILSPHTRVRFCTCLISQSLSSGRVAAGASHSITASTVVVIVLTNNRAPLSLLSRKEPSIVPALISVSAISHSSATLV